MLKPFLSQPPVVIYPLQAERHTRLGAVTTNIVPSEYRGLAEKESPTWLHGDNDAFLLGHRAKHHYVRMIATAVFPPPGLTDKEMSRKVSRVHRLRLQ